MHTALCTRTHTHTHTCTHTHTHTNIHNQCSIQTSAPENNTDHLHSLGSWQSETLKTMHHGTLKSEICLNKTHQDSIHFGSLNHSACAEFSLWSLCQANVIYFSAILKVLHEKSHVLTGSQIHQRHKPELSNIVKK